MFKNSTLKKKKKLKGSPSTVCWRLRWGNKFPWPTELGEIFSFKESRLSWTLLRKRLYIKNQLQLNITKHSLPMRLLVRRWKETGPRLEGSEIKYTQPIALYLHTGRQELQDQPVSSPCFPENTETRNYPSIFPLGLIWRLFSLKLRFQPSNESVKRGTAQQTAELRTAGTRRQHSAGWNSLGK